VTELMTSKFLGFSLEFHHDGILHGKGGRC